MPLEGITFVVCFVGNVPSVKFMYPVFTNMPRGFTVGDTGRLFCPLSVERY